MGNRVLQVDILVAPCSSADPTGRAGLCLPRPLLRAGIGRGTAFKRPRAQAGNECRRAHCLSEGLLESDGLVWSLSADGCSQVLITETKW